MLQYQMAKLNVSSMQELEEKVGEENKEALIQGLQE
jgi:hypothetical protein